MHPFEYVRAESADHALEVLAENGDDATIIAGGQSLLNILKQGLMAPEILLDVKGLDDLAYVAFEPAGGFRIGALTTHRAVETSPDFKARCPVLCEMERTLASVQIRNWGTIGGTLCIADPTSDAAPVLMVLDGQAELRKTGASRTVPLDGFFVDYYETVREDDELLTEVRFALPAKGTAVTYEKFRNVEGDAPIVVASALVALSADGKTVQDVRLALGGVAPTPVRSPAVEGVCKDQAASVELFAEAATAVDRDMEPIPDIVASPEYKTKIAAVLARRTLVRAWEEARSSLEG